MYENIDKNLYTPMMRQYLEIKENYKDTLVNALLFHCKELP